jgi:hypothetical protein
MKPIFFYLLACTLTVSVAFSQRSWAQTKTNSYSVLPEKDAIYFYVSAANGIDKLPGGTISNPFKTLQFAKNFIRNSRWQFRRHVVIFIREGIYELNEPLVFTTDDDSFGQTRITYAAYPGERVIISGGIRLKPIWETRDNRTYYIAFNNPRISNIYQLLINGKPQPMARYPNQDTLNSTREYFGLDNDCLFTDSTMRISANQMPIKKWLRAGTGILNIMDNSGNANLMYQINDFNADKQTYVLGNGGFQTMQPEVTTGSTYFVENIAEELDMPSEWYYNVSAKMLSYMPPANTDINKATADVPVLSSLIQIRGTNKDPVRNLAFVGIEFYATIPNYFDTFEQMGASNWTTTNSAAFQIEGAEQITIANCRFQSIGGNAILIKDYNRRHTIFGNDFQTIGNNAIYLTGNHNQLTGSQRNYPADISIVNNRLVQTGEKIYQSAAICISTAQNIRIQNNDFRQLSSAAICFADNLLGGHQVSSNYITDFGLSVRQKAAVLAYAGEYAYLPVWAVTHQTNFATIENNLIEGTAASSTLAAWLMEGAQNFHMTGNQFRRAGLRFSAGKNRQIRNNIWLGSSELHLWAGSDSLSADTFAMNIISDLTTKRTFAYILHGSLSPEQSFINAYNNIWHFNGALPVQRRLPSGSTQNIPFAEWQKRCETGSLLTDPQLNQDGNITDTSPALLLGIRPLTTTSVGLMLREFLHEK